MSTMEKNNINESETPMTPENIPSEENIPMYDPHTDMFSDNPYDLVTGEFIKKEKVPEKPVVDYKLERKKRYVPVLIMVTLTLPVCAVLYYISIAAATPTNLIINNDTALLGYLFLGVLTVALGTFVINKYNNTLGAKRNLRIDGRIVLVGLPSCLLCASLLTPSYSYVGNAFCLIFIATAYITFALIFAKKLSTGSRVLALASIILMSALCFSTGSYKKLLLFPYDVKADYLVLTKRAEDQIPNDSDRVTFMSTNLNFDKYSFNSQYFKSVEELEVFLAEENQHIENYMIVNNSERNHAGDQLEAQMKDVLREICVRYDRDFFTKHDLQIRDVHMYETVNDVRIANTMKCGETVMFDYIIDYTKPVTNHYFPVDICLEFLIIPKSEYAYSVGFIKGNTTENVTSVPSREV